MKKVNEAKGVLRVVGDKFKYEILTKIKSYKPIQL